jgi:hypothetical protein
LVDVFKDLDHKGLTSDIIAMLEPLGHDAALKAQCHAELFVYNDDNCDCLNYRHCTPMALMVTLTRHQ